MGRAEVSHPAPAIAGGQVHRVLRHLQTLPVVSNVRLSVKVGPSRLRRSIQRISTAKTDFTGSHHYSSGDQEPSPSPLLGACAVRQRTSTLRKAGVIDVYVGDAWVRKDVGLLRVRSACVGGDPSAFFGRGRR